jgi:hypothetical protein
MAGAISLKLCLMTLLILGLPGVARAQAVANGSYECWYGTSPRMGMNFSIEGSGRYKDSDGKAGSYDVAGDMVAFRGGVLDGQRGRFKAGNPPTVMILGPSGAEVETCRLAH